MRGDLRNPIEERKTALTHANQSATSVDQRNVYLHARGS